MKKNTLRNLALIVIILAIGIFGSLYLSKQESKKHPTSQETHANQLLTIINSGSTNFAGYTIAVNKDGSGFIQYASRPHDPRSHTSKTFSKGTFHITNLQNALSQVDDVSKIPVGHCVKSISFGTVTKISYKGKTSQDLTCLAENAPTVYQTLANEISQLQQQALK